MPRTAPFAEAKGGFRRRRGDHFPAPWCAARRASGCPATRVSARPRRWRRGRSSIRPAGGRRRSARTLPRSPVAVNGPRRIVGDREATAELRKRDPPERLARHRGLHEDVGGVDGARGVEDGRGEKAGLGAVPDGGSRGPEAVAQRACAEVESCAASSGSRIGAAPVPGVADADEDFVVLSGLDRGGDVDGEAAEGVLFEAAEAAVDVDRRVEVVERELDLEGASRERGGDADARAVPDAVGEFEILAQLALVPRDGDGAEDGVAWQGLDRLGDFAGRLLVVAGDSRRP